MNGTYKVVMVVLFSICALSCNGARKSPRNPGGTPQQSSSQAAGAKKMAAWLTGGSRLLYESSNYSIYGLEHETVTKPTGRVLLDIFGLKNKLTKAKLIPKYFMFSIKVNDLGGEKISFSSFSFLRNGKEKVDVKQTLCEFEYKNNLAKCEVWIKISDDEMVAEGEMAVYTLAANARGVDTEGETIGVELKRYSFEMKEEETKPEKIYALYLPNE